MNFFKPFQFWPVNHLVVPIGLSHMSLQHKKYKRGSGRKKTKNKRTIRAWVNSSASRVILWHCIRRLTLACISSEISTKPLGMPTHPDWPSLTASRPYLMSTDLFCCPVSTAPLRRPSPTASSGFLFPTLQPAFPCLLPVTSRSRAQAFVWFRTKTNKKIVCLAHPLRSVTLLTILYFDICRVIHVHASMSYGLFWLRELGSET